MTPEARQAIEDLRASTGPGGVRREDFLLLCTEVERQSDLIRRMEAAAVARGFAFTYYEKGSFPVLWTRDMPEDGSEARLKALRERLEGEIESHRQTAAKLHEAEDTIKKQRLER